MSLYKAVVALDGRTDTGECAGGECVQEEVRIGDDGITTGTRQGLKKSVEICESSSHLASIGSLISNDDTLFSS